MLELKNITKKYVIGQMQQQVLKGISIKFRKSEFAFILGASGSGKTTLLNIIGGLDKYDNGDLIIEGVSTKKYDDRDWDAYRNYRVGFIFQSYNLIGHQTILANVEMALTLSGVSKRERKKRAIQALEKVGLKAHIRKRPNQLSGGQMQRVAIARALVNDPEIILADEPTGALDSETSIQIMDLLKEIAKEKLVIMVTHNPELAKEYSTRIIELKDGLILNDTNPCDNDETIQSNKKIRKTSMSFFTSLGLSFNNLLTKKGRTLLTAFAGSIGIIGIALILSLSNGVSEYVANMERDSLSNYPIALEKNSYDFSKLFEIEEDEKVEYNDGKLHSKDDITSQVKMLTDGFIKKNNLKEFKSYLEKNDEIKNYTTEVQYGYDLDLQIYSNKNNYTRINPNNFNIIDTSEMKEEQAGISFSTTNETTPIFKELLDNEDVLNSKYEILAGSMPKNYNEMVLIVGKDNVIPDSVLYALDIKDRKEVSKVLETLSNKENIENKTTEYSYNDILNLSYKLILNTDYYKNENGTYIDYSNDKNYMKSVVDNGLDIKIVGVLRVKDESETANIVGYKHSLTEYVINNIAKTEIYKEQVNNQKIDVLTGEEFDGIVNTYENNCKLLGIADLDNPSVINIYPKDFNAKEKVIELIDKYNQEQKDNNRADLVVTYTDLIKMVVSGVTSIINIVSLVLIGFVAISLIVSSIMIAIITYISVLERTKEIGILRAIGASKKDVSRVFKAETIIEGLIAGLMGIGISLLICMPVNLIVFKLAQIENIARMPLGGAIFLILLSVILNVIAGHIPSKMASKKDPVIALRSE
ncbi:MAG: ABC transporter ATP-binding protein/permease [Clostridia bacterium]|nr:ABC transporter ATP-binding protein/permease [Clostridia bacterium]